MKTIKKKLERRPAFVAFETRLSMIGYDVVADGEEAKYFASRFRLGSSGCDDAQASMIMLIEHV